MAEAGEVDFMKQLLKTGIIGEDWPKVTYLIVIIKNRDGEVVWNEKYQTSDSHKHAEIKMLKDDEFQDEVKKGKVDIILTSNYSPCRDCADELIHFYKDKESSIGEFTIRFSQPYRVNEENRDGLRRLNSAGITLEAMAEVYWFDMVMRYKFDLEPDKVRRRDSTTRYALKKLLSQEPLEYFLPDLRKKMGLKERF